MSLLNWFAQVPRAGGSKNAALGTLGRQYVSFVKVSLLLDVKDGTFLLVSHGAGVSCAAAWMLLEIIALFGKHRWRCQSFIEKVDISILEDKYAEDKRRRGARMMREE